jgi:PAT family beta-lactamase induction signal transducer AmpG
VNAGAGRPLPAPVWAILTLPFGLAIGFLQVAVPHILTDHGVDMTMVATVTSVAYVPHSIKFLWSPALDLGWYRRSWYVGSVLVTAAGLALSAFVPVRPLWLYTAVLFGAEAAAATAGSAALALIALTVPNRSRGAVSGWQTAGNLAGTAGLGGLSSWMFARFTPTGSALGVAATCVVCIAPVWLVHEPPPQRHPARVMFAALFRDVWRTLRSRAGWTGLVLCLSPVGCGGLTSLFSALAKDYARTPEGVQRLVVFVDGFAAAVPSLLGSVLGGYVADRMNRRLAYVLFGALTALCAVGMMVAPSTPAAFTLGVLAYIFANSLCFAAFYAFVLELIGPDAPGVTTQLALYISAANFASLYVTWFDGASYDWAKKLWPSGENAGRNGMLGMDAFSTVVGIVALVAMLAWVRRRTKKG